MISANPISNQRKISDLIRDYYFLQPFVGIYSMDNVIGLSYNERSDIFDLDQALRNDDFILMLTGTMPIKIFLPNNLTDFSRKLGRYNMLGILDLEQYAISNGNRSKYEQLTEDLNINEFLYDLPPEYNGNFVLDLVKHIYSIFNELRSEKEISLNPLFCPEPSPEKTISPKITSFHHRGSKEEPIIFDQQRACFLKILTKINLLILTHGLLKIQDIITQLGDFCPIPINLEKMIKFMIDESLLFLDKDGYLMI